MSLTPERHDPDRRPPRPRRSVSPTAPRSVSRRSPYTRREETGTGPALKLFLPLYYLTTSLKRWVVKALVSLTY